jgi:hypothetical protein
VWNLVSHYGRNVGYVFENRELRRIFGAKRDEMTGECRRLNNKKLYDLYFQPNIIRVIKSRRMRWVGHVERIGQRRHAYGVLVRTLEGNSSLSRHA